jgi:RNA polymerase sigma factor (sigma-70 family)
MHSTCWTVIRGAAGGNQADREQFARLYEPVVRDYLRARWRSGFLRGHLDDAVQDVLVDCFREHGVLGCADAARLGGFRAFLFGVVRNVALRVETKRARDRERDHAGASGVELGVLPADEESLSRSFDRAWAKALVSEAFALLSKRAAEAGEDEPRRAEILRLRFFDGLPIREIARVWGVEPALVHRDYARARTEFRRALVEVVAFDHPGSAAEIDGRCQELLALLARS